MGTSFFMNGDKEKAVEQWKKAKEMGKDSGEFLNRKIAEQQYIEDERQMKRDYFLTFLLCGGLLLDVDRL